MKEEIYKTISKFLDQNIPELQGIYIFGSYATNQETPESDIDIAFLTEVKISPVEKWEIQQKLASVLDKDVDLVDLKDASVVLRTQVINNGKKIMVNDKFKIDYFEMISYSMYADLNETRSEILNDYTEKYGRNPDS